VSPLSVSQVAISFPAFIIVYGILGFVCFWLIIKTAIKGPEKEAVKTLGY
jgi:cytochrome d ubiquinol oxidase subunit I